MEEHAEHVKESKKEEKPPEFDLPKEEKDAYKKLVEVAKGRLEGDIPIGDEYWALREEIRKAKSRDCFNKPPKPGSLAAKEAAAKSREEPKEEKKEVSAADRPPHKPETKL